MSTSDESLVFSDAAWAGALAPVVVAAGAGRDAVKAIAPASALRALVRSTGQKGRSGRSALSAGSRASRRTSSRSGPETKAGSRGVRGPQAPHGEPRGGSGGHPDPRRARPSRTARPRWRGSRPRRRQPAQRARRPAQRQPWLRERGAPSRAVSIPLATLTQADRKSGGRDRYSPASGLAGECAWLGPCAQMATGQARSHHVIQYNALHSMIFICTGL